MENRLQNTYKCFHIADQILAMSVTKVTSNVKSNLSRYISKCTAFPSIHQLCLQSMLGELMAQYVEHRSDIYIIYADL
jgi:hypothetical protein